MVSRPDGEVDKLGDLDCCQFGPVPSETWDGSERYGPYGHNIFGGLTARKRPFVLTFKYKSEAHGSGGGRSAMSLAARITSRSNAWSTSGAHAPVRSAA